VDRRRVRSLRDRPEENGFGIARLGFREGRGEEEAEARRGRAAGGECKRFSAIKAAGAAFLLRNGLPSRFGLLEEIEPGWFRPHQHGWAVGYGLL